VAALDRKCRADWVVVVWAYVATIVVADVTTTNVLGRDATRIRNGCTTGARSSECC